MFYAEGNIMSTFFFVSTSKLLLVYLCVVTIVKICNATSIKLDFHRELSSIPDGTFRLNYQPSQGVPPPNFSFRASQVAKGLEINNVIPGIEYAFQLYHTNASSSDRLIWTKTIATEPDLPSDLSVDVHSGKVVDIRWDSPKKGGFTGYRLTIVPLSKDAELRTIDVAVDASPFTLRDLTPGATYEVQLQSMFLDKVSTLFLSSNFTTKPNAPGRFIVWFRNETTLLVLWQAPYPSGIFNQYRASILPEDAVQSVLYIDKEGDPPGPAQAAFYGLVPGRAYNISVQTVSGNQISAPTEAQYLTLPLPPTNITFDPDKITPASFQVRWSPPKLYSEFDRYQVALGVRHTFPPRVIGRDEESVAIFNEGLEPGRTYEIEVITVSGNVVSWPVKGNVTTRPLPVLELTATSGKSSEIVVEWKANNGSIQDSYKVKYQDLDAFNIDGIVQVVQDTRVHLTNLLAGRNYSISVVAVTKGISSEESIVYQPTRPSSPVIEILESVPEGVNVSWKSDVTSRQDMYAVVYVRTDTGFKQNATTKNNWLVLDDLYPGAGYEIKVFAISYGLWSEPHSYFQTVPPKPPENVQIVKATNSTMILTWNTPLNSLVDHYTVKYKPVHETVWKEMGVINTTSCEIQDLVAGERYVVRVASVSNRVETPDAVEVEQTLYPNAIKHARHILDAQNITFEWEVPQGHVDYYNIVYNTVRDPLSQHLRQVASNVTDSDGMVSIIIDNLKPGEWYSFRIYAVSHNVRSEGIGIQTRTMPVIDSVINVVTNELETRTLGIKYTPTLTRNVVFDRYRFQLSDSNVPAQEKLYNDTNRLVLFDNLTPGRLYNISIWTVSGGVYSVPIHRQARLYPEPIKEITALTITDTEITLAWETPFGNKDGYEVQYLDHNGQLIQNITFTERIAYTSLRPHHSYTFVVTVLSGFGTSTMLRSSTVSQTFQTSESVPGKVQYFQSAEVTPNSIILQWTLPPNEQNGVLTGFKVTYAMKGSTSVNYTLFDADKTQGTIKYLIPGKTYIFQIQAHTKIGPGHKSVWEETMPIWAPPPPPENVFPTEVGHTTTTIRIKYRKQFFSNTHGVVMAYAIIVAETGSKDNQDLDLPTWGDVQSYTIWPPYQVAKPYFPFNGTLVEDFTIGTDECKGVRGYCNGPLKAGSSYRVKIRAFTAPDKFTDTVYSYAIKTDPDNTALIVGILVPLSLLLVMAIILLVLRRRRVGPFTKKSMDPHGKDDALSIPESEIITSRPIKLKDFVDHYRIMSADSDFRFSEEFELLKHVGREKPSSAADLPVNRPKNRFTNILPYDHSRVKLSPTDDEEGSDYINANYIHGFNSPREFIVTQGPLHSTRDDFWRMVWEQNCRAIVMLTRCIEKGREKCDHYWPFDTQPVYYGDIQVTILNESQYPDWTISEFKVCRGDQSRVVRHFHFTTWPDFGVPDPPQTLVKFVRAFRERISPDTKPIIVHCSAGVGRSGTFIALDRILQHIQKYDSVDIFGIVYEMRKERVWMVQNEQQYVCIHQCLLCVLEGKEDLLDSPRPEAHDNKGFEAFLTSLQSRSPRTFCISYPGDGNSHSIFPSDIWPPKPDCCAPS